MSDRIMETDEEYLERLGDGTPEGNFARAGGYNRMANAAVADYNSRPAPDDWNGALAHQRRMDEQRQAQERNAAMAQRIATQRDVFDNYVGSGLRQISQKAQAQDLWDDHVASAMALSARNGGRLPQYMIPGLNQARGLDGKTASIYGGGYTKDGKGFVLAVARRDPNTGQVVPDRDATVRLDLRGMYDLMYNKPGIFNRQQLQGVHDLLNDQLDKATSGQKRLDDIPAEWGRVDTVGPVGVGNRTESGGTAVPSSWLYGPQRRSSISAFGANGRGGFTQYESNEQTGYQLQQRDFGTRAPEPDLSERERIARMKEQGLNDREELKERGRLDRAVMSEEGRLARGEGGGRGGLTFEQRMQLEEQKNKRLETQEQGRSARAKQGDDMSKARLVATVSRNWYDLKNSLGLSDEQAEGLQDWMAKSFTQAFAPSRGGQATPAPSGTPLPSGKTEVKQGDNGGGDGKQFKEGDVQEINGIKMKLLPSKKNPGKLTWQRV